MRRWLYIFVTVCDPETLVESDIIEIDLSVTSSRHFGFIYTVQILYIKTRFILDFFGVCGTKPNKKAEITKQLKCDFVKHFYCNSIF